MNETALNKDMGKVENFNSELVDEACRDAETYIKDILSTKDELEKKLALILSSLVILIGLVSKFILENNRVLLDEQVYYLAAGLGVHIIAAIFCLSGFLPSGYPPLGTTPDYWLEVDLQDTSKDVLTRHKVFILRDSAISIKAGVKSNTAKASRLRYTLILLVPSLILMSISVILGL